MMTHSAAFLLSLASVSAGAPACHHPAISRSTLQLTHPPFAALSLTLTSARAPSKPWMVATHPNNPRRGRAWGEERAVANLTDGRSHCVSHHAQLRLQREHPMFYPIHPILSPAAYPQHAIH